MEMLSMGPGRRPDDTLLQIADDGDAEPVDLGVRSRPSTHDGKDEPLDLDERSQQVGDADDWDEPTDVPSEHWLAGVLRAEVLGASGAAVLLLIAIGLPFLSALEMFPFYGGPIQASTAWTFAPSLLAAAVAAALGLGGLRQAAYQGAATWARVVSGVAAVVGTFMVIGAAVVWFAVAQSDLLSQFG